MKHVNNYNFFNFNCYLYCFTNYLYIVYENRIGIGNAFSKLISFTSLSNVFLRALITRRNNIVQFESFNLSVDLKCIILCSGIRVCADAS